MAEMIVTVLGPIPPQKLKCVLPHEHIMVDFKGPSAAGHERYKRPHVIEIMKPFLEAAASSGVTCLADCTTRFMARDPRVLAMLSKETGVHIITNTGFYKDPFLPAEVLDFSIDRIVEEWCGEWERGIDDTGIRPGFIKTAVHPEPLNELDERMIRAGARTMNRTGLPMMTHTLLADRAQEIVRILEEEDADVTRWIFAHAHREVDFRKLVDIAKKGMWIGLDGVGEDSLEQHADLLLQLLNLGFEDRLLISQDAGWYRVGDEPGGHKKPYTYLCSEFLPYLEERGVHRDVLEKLTHTNPVKAYSLDL